MSKTILSIMLSTVLVALGFFVGSAKEVSGPWVEEIQAPQYFALYVEDVDSSVDWYCSVFGLEKSGGSQAEDGSWRIENLRNSHLAVEIIYDKRAQSAERVLGFRKVGFYVKDVETVARRVAEATGVEPRVVEFEQLGQRILQLKDPEGNTVQLMSLQE